MLPIFLHLLILDALIYIFKLLHVIDAHIYFILGAGFGSVDIMFIYCGLRFYIYINHPQKSLQLELHVMKINEELSSSNLQVEVVHMLSRPTISYHHFISYFVKKKKGKKSHYSHLYLPKHIVIHL